MLPPARLAAIAQRIAVHFDATALVLPQTQRAIEGADTELVYPAPTDVGLTSWPCRLQPGKPPAAMLAATEDRSLVWWEVWLPVASRLVPTDRLWVAGLDANGVAYTHLIQVVGPTGPHTWEAVRIVTGWEILPDTPATEG